MTKKHLQRSIIPKQEPVILLPAVSFLDQVETTFSVIYPDSFRECCRRLAGQNLASLYSTVKCGRFVTNMDTLCLINKALGEEEWGDYEQAIAGRRHDKDGTKLWGGLIPVFYETSNDRELPLGRRSGDSIYGFDKDDPLKQQLLVWSVHCIVGEEPDIWALLRPRQA